MGLEESPHCPFDVMEACRTGVDKERLKMEGRQERPVVAAAGMMVVQRRRWIETRAPQRRTAGGK